MEIRHNNIKIIDATYIQIYNYAPTAVGTATIVVSHRENFLEMLIQKVKSIFCSSFLLILF